MRRAQRRIGDLSTTFARIPSPIPSPLGRTPHTTSVVRRWCGHGRQAPISLRRLVRMVISPGELPTPKLSSPLDPCARLIPTVPSPTAHSLISHLASVRPRRSMSHPLSPLGPPIAASQLSWPLTSSPDPSLSQIYPTFRRCPSSIHVLSLAGPSSNHFETWCTILTYACAPRREKLL